MKIKEIRELSDQELVTKVADLKGELFNLRFRSVTGQLDNPSAIKDVKRTIASIKTIIREREIQAQG